MLRDGIEEIPLHRLDFEVSCQDKRFLCLRDLGLFPDLGWEKEVRWERTAIKERRTRVKLGDESDR